MAHPRLRAKLREVMELVPVNGGVGHVRTDPVMDTKRLANALACVLLEFSDFSRHAAPWCNRTELQVPMAELEALGQQVQHVQDALEHVRQEALAVHRAVRVARERAA